MITRFAALISFLGVCTVIGALYKALYMPPTMEQIRSFYFAWQVQIHAGAGIFMVTTVYLALLNLFGTPPTLNSETTGRPTEKPVENPVQKEQTRVEQPVRKIEPAVVAPSKETPPVEVKVETKVVEQAVTTEKSEPKVAAVKENGIPAAAYQILYLFQKEGRLLDFLMEDISGVDDDQLGGAIRPIHEGCRKILQERLKIEPVLQGPEGETIKVPEPHDPQEVKLTGNVPAKGPFSGTLVHRGWRLTECKLPELVSGWSGDVIAPAEVEIQ